MNRKEDILSTVRMFQEENLDVRTVTLGINITDCVSSDVPRFCENLIDKITRVVSPLVPVCERISDRYGIPVVNKRLAISPLGAIGGQTDEAGYLQLAHTLDHAAESVGVDLLGGFTALVQKGTTPSEARLMESLPRVLSQTDRICASINVATSKAGNWGGSSNWLRRKVQTRKDTDADTISALIADEMAIGVINQKTTPPG